MKITKYGITDTIFRTRFECSVAEAINSRAKQVIKDRSQQVKKEDILENEIAILLIVQVWNQNAAYLMKLKSILQQMGHG